MEPWLELIRRVEDAHGVVTHSDLVAAGVSRRRIDRDVRSGRLVPTGQKGTYRIAGAPPTFGSEVAAALRDVGRDGLAYASHHTAARLLGMRVHPRDRRIEITRPYGLSASRAHVIVHRSTRIPPHHTTIVGGLPAMTASRTAFDLARSLPPGQLARLITHATQTHEIACTLPSLYRVLYDLGGRGRPGTRRFRADLDSRSLDEPPTESVLDELGRSLLHDVPGIEWQVEMSDEKGYIRRVDGLVRHAGLVIELDSVFHDDPAQKALDSENDRRLLDAHGLVTRRLRWHDVTVRGDLTHAEILRLCTSDSEAS